MTGCKIKFVGIGYPLDWRLEARDGAHGDPDLVKIKIQSWILGGPRLHQHMDLSVITT